MAVPFKYSIRSFGSRKLTTIITISGIALVVFVFAAVLMMAYGIEKTLVSTGSPDNLIVIRKASTGEISSIIDGDTQNIIRTLPYLGKTSDGKPMITNDLVVIINLNKFGGGLSNVTVRGVSQVVREVRPQVKIIEGRMFNSTLRELIVGESVAKNFEGTQIGQTIKFAGDNWKIVGKFTTDGSGFDSEIWGDVSQLQDAFNR
ncbi:MAG: ABC transporter permease, partial [Ignavibacteria bacterium]